MTVDPAALRQIAAQLQPGVVLRLFSPIADKYKRQLLIYAGGDRSLAFMINSQPAPFIRRNPERLKRQVLMPQSLHPFMDRDSHIACDEPVGIACRDGTTGTMRDLVRAIAAGHIEILGALHESVYAAIVIAADGARTISPRDAVLIVAAFTQETEAPAASASDRDVSDSDEGS